MTYSAPTFSVGEVALLQRCGLESANGSECTVIDTPKSKKWSKKGPWKDGLTRTVRAGCYVVEYDGDIWQVGPHQLRKRPQPGEREELGSWDLCPWRPGRVVTQG
jgi:hypothetical protein